jgi:Na+-translocating ferredoxin:NAD+ oxidoreductase RnfG subunit
MAKFFKSAYFKCAVTLLAIILLSGISISILSDVLYVSSEERTGRALQKIYGRALSSSEYHVVLDSENGDKAESYAFGEIEKIFRVGDENAKHDMIFKTTGKEGYKGGTVTLWIKVIVDGNNLKIDKVVIDGNTKQTLMSKLGDSYLKGFYIDISNNYSTYFSAYQEEDTKRNPVTGASMSAQAGCNAVNCVIEYLKGDN